jgi:pyruvate dehydrogenase E2 component (dihydrolipoamide acetyltransferase)
MGKMAAPAQAEPGGAPAPADIHPAGAGRDGQSAPAAPPATPAQPAGPAGAGPVAPASPVARRMADEAGIDIRQIQGSGPGGRITKKDVEAFLRQPQPAAQAAPPPAVAPAAPPVVTTEDRAVPLTRLRQIIARRMTESKQQVPQFYVTADVDMAAAMELRKQLNAYVPEDQRISVNDFVIKAVALTLREFPNLNAAFSGDKVIQRGRVNVGNAVAVEGGLLTIVVQDADRKSLAVIATEMKAMGARARSGKVQPADIEGSTFSVSNLGMYDVDRFIAIINPPEAGILAVGTVRQVPVVRDRQIVPGQQMQITVSADHRVTDGAEAARFVQAVKQKLEQPLRLVL